MESASGAEEYVGSFSDWKTRAIGLEEKLDLLEREEEEVGKLYSDILQSVYLQTCFYITLCSYLAALFVKKVAFLWLLGFVVSVVICYVAICYVAGVVLPMLLAFRQLSGLKLTCQKLIQRREKLVELCSIMLGEYNQIYVSESSSGASDDLLRDISSYSIEKLEGLKKEDPVPKFRKGNNRKIVLVLGVCCSIFTVMYLFYALYIAYYDARALSPGGPPVSSRPTQLITRVALKSLYSNLAEQ